MSDMEYFQCYQGEKIALLVGGDWILDEYLSGRIVRTEKKEADTSHPSFAVAKFSCHVDGDESKKGFFRMYRQIPYKGTLRQSPQEKRQRAVKAPKKHSELEALLALQNCDAVAGLLAYEVGEQDDNDLVPGGYFIHLVWAQAPGLPLDKEVFWEVWTQRRRQDIREQFRKAFEKIIASGWEPSSAGFRKIIYDHATNTIKIAGFQNAFPTNPTEAWRDTLYTSWGLAIPSRRRDWKKHPEEWTW